MAQNSPWEQMFRAYDIRGIYGKDLTLDIAGKIGMAFGTFLGAGKKLAVGRDIRNGGEQLRDVVVRGLVSTGCDVEDLGVVTTPILYFAIAHRKKDGGVMVTASHNPAEWNGLKLCREKGIIVGQGSGIEQVKDIIKQGKYAKPARKGRVEVFNGIMKEYSTFILSQISLRKKLKVILDTANSVPGVVAPKLFSKLGCEITVLNEKLDGNFPGRSPEPKAESLQQLMQEVKKSKADLGVGYDADGDRAVFVDDLGRILTGDFTSIIFARALISEQKRKVVIDVSCSSALEEAVKESGGIPIIERVGRPFMMNRVLSENAVFGGERSGHFYFPQIYGLDDGIFASLQMAEILSKSSEPLSKIIDAIPKYPSVTLNVPCADEIKFKVVGKLKAKFQARGFSILDIDGVKARDERGWVLLRPSNTEPLIRIFAEARTQDGLDQLLELAKAMLKEEVENAT